MGKTVAIMQPYLLPYIGYYQLINEADLFVVYDDIQFSKKSWVNRNRILENGAASYFSIPIRKDSDYLDIRDRVLSELVWKELGKITRRIEANYRKAPFFDAVMPFVSQIFNQEQSNLFDFVFGSIEKSIQFLNIKTSLVISSSIDPDLKNLRSENRVIETCKKLGASKYLNPIGGLDLYSGDNFKKEGIELGFLRTKEFEYPQGDRHLESNLSIIDVLMFNSLDEVQSRLKEGFEIISGQK